MTHKRDVTAQEDAALNAALRSSTVKVEHPEIASLRAELDACETELRIARTSQAESNAEVERLRAELETERMRLVACSVIALANTPESAASARDMHPDYRSASCDDVARAIDREIALRAELAECRHLLKLVVCEGCDQLDHGPDKAFHGFNDPCPILERIDAALAKGET